MIKAEEQLVEKCKSLEPKSEAVECVHLVDEVSTPEYFAITSIVSLCVLLGVLFHFFTR